MGCRTAIGVKTPRCAARIAGPSRDAAFSLCLLHRNGLLNVLLPMDASQVDRNQRAALQRMVRVAHGPWALSGRTLAYAGMNGAEAAPSTPPFYIVVMSRSDAAKWR
ncbi:hypothetical protein NDU88_004142 [Pleurodeles waltl]|uniref:Uncharacterized protein n=1 Tax=Pleurodeles waltl TaxID=8319 RepID=A0AAV7QC30_PLEWA|nr:hypothetical protein NDU88_004142 [Pleurodeles waltl]